MSEQLAPSASIPPLYTGLYSDLDGFFFRPENIGWLLVIKGYFDETFDEHSGIVWVAGHYGDEEAWTRYVVDWKQSLGQRKQLHMADPRWKKAAEKDMLSRLGPITQKSNLRPLIAGVRTGDIADLIAGTRLKHHANGYVLSVIGVTTQALLNLPDGEHLEVVFEDRDQTREHAGDALFVMHMMGYFAETDSRLESTPEAPQGFLHVTQGKTDAATRNLPLTPRVREMLFARRQMATDSKYVFPRPARALK